jgi:hypothetical protein
MAANFAKLAGNGGVHFRLGHHRISEIDRRVPEVIGEVSQSQSVNLMPFGK